MIGRDLDPHGELRQLTAKLASLLASESGTLALARLQRQAILSSPRAQSRAPDSGLRIGVWTPDIHPDGAVEFVRNRAFAHEWRYWADVERIPARQGPRVVLLGESVARGYLFDPAITPAALLSAQLGGRLGGIDVVDLARTDLSLDGLRALFDGLPALQPDVIVVFAGNNWHNIVFTLGELQRLAAAVRQDGFAGCRTAFLDIVAGRARSLVDDLAASAAEFAIPVVIVVPEFNLADWRGEPSVGAPVLPGNANLRWLELRRAAEEALAAGRHADAARLAAELHELDGGTSAVGPTILALAQPEEARLWLERARDAVVGLLIGHSPRCPAVVQNVLRDESVRHGFTVIDLPRIFAAVPDRGVFIDYCHLTPHGMRVAMKAVAAAIAPIVGVTTIVEEEPAVPAQHEATGHFLAAIHNAHYGQPADILRHHCSKAAALSATVRQQMAWYVECATRWPEAWLCDALARLCESPVVRRYLLAPEVRSQKLADFQLMDAMLAALDATGVGIRPAMDRLLIEQHGTCERVDLLNPRYRASTFRERGGYSLSAERAFVRATALTSTFALIRAQPGLVQLHITCRVPARGDVAVRINGAEAGVLHAGTTWHTSAMTIRAREGLNWLEVNWPAAAPPAGELDRAADRLERGAYPDVLPWYGDIHALTANNRRT